MLAIAGVVALLGSLALVSISFSLVNMGDKTQALGLPQGSVRAVIALSLVVLFAILTVYLFSSLNTPQQFREVASCMDDGTSAQMLTQQRSGELMTRVPVENAAGTCKGLSGQRYNVLIQQPANPDAIDFAKQLLVLIGTLVTSVASFYFGSKAVGEARDVVAGLNVQPWVHGVEPATLTQGGKDLTLDLLGTGLNGARQVQVSRTGEAPLNAISVTSNDNRVHAKFNVPPDAPLDDPAWDVTVTDGQGRSFRLPAAVKIVAPDKTGSDAGSTGGGAAGGGGAGGGAAGGGAAGGGAAGTGAAGAGTAPPGVAAGTAPGTTPGVASIAPVGATGALATLREKLEAEKTAIAALGAIDKGAALPTPPDATLAELNQFLAAADTLTKGPSDAAAIATSVQTGTALLEKVQNAGLPGSLADVIAVLQRVGTVAAPAVAGIPAGPVGIVLGVLSGLIALAGDQQKLNAAKAALLNVPFDPGTPPTAPTRDMATIAVEGTAFASASPDQALAIMQAALTRRDGQLLPADEVATVLLGNPQTAPLLQQFATPAMRAQAIDQLRSGALFRQARALLTDMAPHDAPAAAGSPAGKVSLPALLDWLQGKRGDPQVAAAIEKLANIAEALGKLPADKQPAINQLVTALEAAASLAQTRRQS